MSVYLNAPALPFNTRQWDKLLRNMLAAVDLAPDQVNLYLERDGRLAELNRAFMACPGPTNILSFPGNSKDLLGEICIGYDTLRREAHLYGQSLKTHAVFLLAHGLTHVLGYNHGQEMDKISTQLTKIALEPELL